MPCGRFEFHPESDCFYGGSVVNVFLWGQIWKTKLWTMSCIVIIALMHWSQNDIFSFNVLLVNNVGWRLTYGLSYNLFWTMHIVLRMLVLKLFQIWQSPYQLNLLWFCGVFGRPETNKQWNDTGPNIYLTVSRAIQVLHKWINARNLQQPESTSLNNEDFAWWEPPPSGFLKYIGINYKLGGFVSEMPMVCL